MIKEFSELFKAFSKVVGFGETFTNKIIFIILLSGFVFTIFKLLYQLLKLILNYFRQRKINKDLHPFFTPTDVKNATKFFIKTKFQNISPAEDEEPSRRYIASAKDELMPLFLKKVFPFGKSDNKYYLILADSGMGKTTFLINLYIRYKNKFRTIFKMRPYSIKLIPIWHQDAIEYISKIQDPENTILLLDAFDENVSAQDNYFRTLKNILLKVSKFRIVVMTCRTQFFPSQKEEPHETGYFTAGENGEFYFQKLYISVFDDKDVKKYLRNKFPFIWQRRNYLRAKEITKKCPNLVIRPMLLNHITDLLGKEKTFEFSFQVYEELINSWIRREAKKSGIKEKYQTEKRFIRLLIKFSEKIAINIYMNRDNRGGYYIPKGEQINEGVLTLEEFNELQDGALDENDSRTRSLLTRNADGDYKFSHKSILEYFLAKALFNKQFPFEYFNFFGMDMVSRFLEEMVIHKLKTQTGKFSYKTPRFSNEQEQSLNNLSIEKIDQVTFLFINDFTCIQPEQFSIFKNLKKLILIDEIAMKELYFFYIGMYDYFHDLLDQIKEQKLPKDGKQKWQKKFSEFEIHNLVALKKYLESLGNEKMEELNEALNLATIKEYDSTEFSLNNPEKLSSMKRVNEIVESILWLRARLPECKIYF